MDQVLANNSSTILFKPSLGTIDFLVLVVMLLISLLIGLFYLIKDRGNQTNETYLMAGKNMSVAPVAMSLCSTYMSANTLLGWPTEMYTKGANLFVIGIIGTIACSIFAAEVCVPIFYRLNLTSVNQYLSDRFGSSTVRSVTSAFVILSTMPQLGICLYGPALVLGSVTGVTITQCVLVMGGICTIYTSLGGLKAVIWTDVIQYGLMYAGIVMIMIKGTTDAGGFEKVFQVSHQGGRLSFFDFTFDLYSSGNFYFSVIGASLIWSGGYVNQMQVQRTCAMPTMEMARKVIYCAIPGFLVMIMIVCYLGLVIFANYSHCDPYRGGLLSRPDEILPFFVSQSLGNEWPGLPGLFVASIFSASLSTLSSALNAMAALIWDDFLKHHLPEQLPDATAVLITRLIAVLIGLISIGMAFLASNIGTVFEASYILAGATNGPIFGLFVMGMFVPCVNGTGGLIGLLVGAIFCTFITVGGIMNPRPDLILPSSIESCVGKRTIPGSLNFGFEPEFDVSTLSMINDTMIFDDMFNHAVIQKYHPVGLNALYHLSPFIIPVLGFLVTSITAIVVSKVTEFRSNGKREQIIDPKLMVKLVMRGN